MIINGFGGSNTIDVTTGGTLVSSSTVTLSQTETISGLTNWPAFSNYTSGNYLLGQLDSSNTVPVGDLLSKYSSLVLKISVTSITTPKIDMSMSVTTNSGGSVSQSFVWPFRYYVGCGHSNNSYQFMPLYYRDCNYSYTFGSTGTKTVTVPAANFGAITSNTSIQQSRLVINRLGLSGALGEWLWEFERSNLSSASNQIYGYHGAEPYFDAVFIRLGIAVHTNMANVNASIPNAPKTFSISGASATIKYDIYGG